MPPPTIAPTPARASTTAEQLSAARFAAYLAENDQIFGVTSTISQRYSTKASHNPTAQPTSVDDSPSKALSRADESFSPLHINNIPPDQASVLMPPPERGRLAQAPIPEDAYTTSKIIRKDSLAPAPSSPKDIDPPDYDGSDSFATTPDINVRTPMYMDTTRNDGMSPLVLEPVVLSSAVDHETLLEASLVAIRDQTAIAMEQLALRKSKKSVDRGHSPGCRTELTHAGTQTDRLSSSQAADTRVNVSAQSQTDVSVPGRLVASSVPITADSLAQEDPSTAQPSVSSTRQYTAPEPIRDPSPVEPTPRRSVRKAVNNPSAAKQAPKRDGSPAVEQTTKKRPKTRSSDVIVDVQTLAAVVAGGTLPANKNLAVKAAEERKARLEDLVAQPSKKSSTKLKKQAETALKTEFADPGVTRKDSTQCVCRTRKHHMKQIQCDTCEVWQHISCMEQAVPKDIKNARYECHVCDPWGHRHLLQKLRQKCAL